MSELAESMAFVRTARERLKINSVVVEVFAEHYALVADAYLAEHPEDSDEPVTVEWLQSIGMTHQWYDNAWGTNEYGHEIGVAVCVPSGGVMIATEGVITAPKGLDCPTRGDVRRLCRGLKIELGERK